MNRPVSSSALQSQLDKALGLHRAGRVAEARRIYEKVLRRHPGQPDATHLLGVAALDAGDAKAAVRLISQAATRLPPSPHLSNNLGNALRAAGRRDEALLQYEAAVRLQPRFAAAHCNLGVLYNDLGRTGQAIVAFEAALAIDAGLFEAHLGLGRAYAAQAAHQEEARALSRALAARPGHPVAQNLLAVALAHTGAAAEARALVDAILTARPQDLEALQSCARALHLLGAHAEAAAVYRRATGLRGAGAQLWNEAGRAERVLGDLDAAAAAFRKALELDASSWDARRNLALIGRADDAATAEVAMRREGGAASDWDAVLAGFTLGDVLDKQGDHDAAFAEYAEANRRLRTLQSARGLIFDHDVLRARVDAILAAPTPRPTPIASVSEAPVFIVGMPRSGTSLVEQILASHSLVHGAGERRALLALQQAQKAAALSAVDVETYLADWANGSGAQRVLDKMPDNVFLLDTVATCFPRARVIYCERNPYDLVLSCYFQLWQDRNTFSTDLADCARRLAQVSRLVARWQGVFGERFTIASYEALVGDLESESRRLIAFLGLDWEPTCLEFHLTERPVATASGWQVRQPLYATSVGRWRGYRRQLGEVQQILAAACSDWVLPD